MILDNFKRIYTGLNEDIQKVESELANTFPLNVKQREARLQLSDRLRALQRCKTLFHVQSIEAVIKNLENELASTSNNHMCNELKRIMKRIKSELISYDDEIGITELSDPSTNNTWVNRLRPKANIIISKNIAPISSVLLQNKYRIILHVTCTGLGGSVWEPNVPHPAIQIKATEELIKSGFPKEQIVLRLDPIILHPEAVKAHHLVLEYFGMLGIKRCRYSFLDQYDHVKQRMQQVGLPTTKYFTYGVHQIKEFSQELITKFGSQFEFESCAEPNTTNQLPCISQKDLDILGVKSIRLIGKKSSRKNCLCPLNKVELMRAVPGQCPHNCIYCFWRKM